MSLSNPKCMIQPTLTTLHPNKNSQEFHYHPFAIKLDRRVGSCNTLNDLTVCSYHVIYAFHNESTLYSCLNIKELFAQSRREI